MFAPAQVQQRAHVTKWVKASMTASTMAIELAMDGKLPVDLLPSTLESILQGAVNEIMKMGVKPNVEPSKN